MNRWLALLALGILGCGSSAPSYQIVPFSGCVKLDGKPLSNAKVFFAPTANTTGPGAFATTDSTGKYELLIAADAGGGQRTTGIVPGEYKVYFSKLIKPDGTEIPAESIEPPINLGAIEALPRELSSPHETTQTAMIPSSGSSKDFELSSKGLKSLVGGPAMMPR